MYNKVVPIKIKNYNDKIWYFKDNLITNNINEYNKYDFFPNKYNEINSTSKKYDLQFLNDKIIFKTGKSDSIPLAYNLFYIFF